jgi:hypothetical protein
MYIKGFCQKNSLAERPNELRVIVETALDLLYVFFPFMRV